MKKQNNIEVRPVVGYEGLYEIDTQGNLYSLRFNKRKKMKPNVNSRGYYKAGLSIDGKYNCVKIHRLVAEAFIDKIAGKEHVNHIDGNKLNNNVNNLEWCTHKENVHHAIKNNLFKPFQNIKREGENNGNSKLNNEQVLAIVKDNRLHKEIAKEYKIDSSHVSTIKNGKYWSSITGIKYEKTRITSEDYNVCTEGRL